MVQKQSKARANLCLQKWFSLFFVLAAIGFMGNLHAAGVTEAPPSPFSESGKKLPKVEGSTSFQIPVTATRKPIEKKVEEGEETEEAAGENKQEKKVEWQRWTPEQLAADSSALYLSIPNCQEGWKKFKTSSFGQLLDEQVVKDRVIAGWKDLRQAILTGDGLLSNVESQWRSQQLELLDRFTSYLQDGVAVSIERIPSNWKDARVLIILTLKHNDVDTRLELEELMDAFRNRRIAEARFRETAEEVGNYSITSLNSPTEGFELSESWAFAENLFLYGIGKNVVKDALERKQSGQGTLASSVDFAASYSQVGQDALLYLHVYNPLRMTEGLGTIQKTFIEGTGKEMAKYAGVDVGRLAQFPYLFSYGVHLEEKTKLLREQAVFPAILDQLGSDIPTFRNLSAQFTPGNAMFYSAGYVDFGIYMKSFYTQQKELQKKFFNRLQSAMNSASAEDMLKKFTPFKGEFSISGAFVPTFGPNVSAADRYQIIVAAEVDREKQIPAKMCIDRLMNATGEKYIQESYLGTKLFYQEGTVPGTSGERKETSGVFFRANEKDGSDSGSSGPVANRLPFFRALASIELMDEGTGDIHSFYIFSDSLVALKKAVRQWKSKHTSLDQNEEFKNLIAGFKKKQRLSLAYVALHQVVDLVYSQLVPRLYAMMPPDRSLNLPPAEVLIKRMRILGLSTSKVKAGKTDGVLTEFTSSTGTLPLLVGGIALGFPKLQEQMQLTISDQVDEKFRKIGLALHLYAADFDRFPTRLSDLYPQYIDDLTIFDSPFAEGAVKADIDDPEKTNLNYISEKDLRGFSQDIQIYEKRPTFLPRQSDNRKVLYHILQLDGRAKGIPEAALFKALGIKKESKQTAQR